MVVADQLNRPRHPDWAKRLVYSTGTSHLLPINRIGPGVIVVLAALLIIVALAWLRPQARLVGVLFLVAFGVLLQSPPTYVHYGSFIAPSLAILFGVAVAEAVRLIRRLGPMTARRLGEGLVVAAVGAVLATLAVGQAVARVDVPAPTRRFAAVARSVRGCITYDEPSEALSLNLVSRDLEQGCPFLVDLGAASHWSRLRVERNGHPSRSEAIALHYLRGGSAALLYRYRDARHAGRPVNIIGRWSLVARDHRLRLVKPVPERTGRT